MFNYQIDPLKRFQLQFLILKPRVSIKKPSCITAIFFIKSVDINYRYKFNSGKTGSANFYYFDKSDDLKDFSQY